MGGDVSLNRALNRIVLVQNRMSKTPGPQDHTWSTPKVDAGISDTTPTGESSRRRRGPGDTTIGDRYPGQVVQRGSRRWWTVVCREPRAFSQPLGSHAGIVGRDDGNDRRSVASPQWSRSPRVLSLKVLLPPGPGRVSDGRCDCKVLTRAS